MDWISVLLYAILHYLINLLGIEGADEVLNDMMTVINNVLDLLNNFVIQ